MQHSQRNAEGINMTPLTSTQERTVIGRCDANVVELQPDLTRAVARFDRVVRADRRNFRLVLGLLIAGTALTVTQPLTGSTPALFVGLLLVAVAVLVNAAHRRRMRIETESEW